MNNSALKWLLTSTLIAVMIWTGWKEIKAQGADLLPIKYVRIEGVFQYIAKDKIKQALLSQVMSGFLNADVQRIREAMLNLPWVAQVKVKRVWPDAIEIKIYEQYPVVRWGQVGLLNEYGDLFVPDDLDRFKSLPMLYGPEGYQKKLMEIMKALQIRLAEQSLALSELSVNERRSWLLVLTNGLELNLGRKDPLKKLQRFLKTLPILGKQRLELMAKIDLRYPNGYAVTWKKDAGIIDWNHSDTK